MAHRSWYVARDGEPVGPLSAATLEAMIQRGELREEHLVWTEGFDRWLAAVAITALRRCFARVRGQGSWVRVQRRFVNRADTHWMRCAGSHVRRAATRA